MRFKSIASVITVGSMVWLAGCSNQSSPVSVSEGNSENVPLQQTINDPGMMVTGTEQKSTLNKTKTLWSTDLHWDYYNIIRPNQNGQIRWFLRTNCNDGIDTKARIRDAFAKWQPYCKATFAEAATIGQANIVISFLTGNSVTFVDGSTENWSETIGGGISVTFGWGFAPLDDRRGLGLDDVGDIYINDNVTWTNSGTTVRAYGYTWSRSTVEVLTHEIGHALGMDHDASSALNIMCGGDTRTNRTGTPFGPDIETISHLYYTGANFLFSQEGTNRLFNTAFNKVLNRNPSTAELSSYRAKLVYNYTPGLPRYTIQNVYAELISSQEFWTNKAGSNNTTYVTECYRRIYNREPDNAGLNYYVNLLNNRTYTRLQVANEFVTTPEYCIGYVSNLYTTLLGRSVDAAGLNYWVGQMQAGLYPERMFAEFCASDEFMINRTGTPAIFISRLYTTVLGRTPSQADINAWTPWIE